MTSTSNGVCKKNKLGQRQHSMVLKLDGEGRKVTACEKCGAAYIRT